MLNLSHTKNCLRKDAGWLYDKYKKLPSIGSFLPNAKQVLGVFGSAKKAIPSKANIIGDDASAGSWTPEQVGARAYWNYLRENGVNSVDAMKSMWSNRNVTQGAQLPSTFVAGKDYLTPTQLLSNAKTAQGGSEAFRAAMADKSRGESTGARFLATINDPVHGQTFRAGYNLAATPQGRDFITRYQDFNRQRLTAQIKQQHPEYDDATVGKLVDAHNSVHSMDFMRSMADLGGHLAPKGTLDEQYKAATSMLGDDISALERLQANPDNPDEADVARAAEINKNQYRKAAVARAMHASESAEKTDGSISYKGKTVNPKARSYAAVHSGLGEQLQPAQFYMSNKDVISDLRSLQSGNIWNNLLWVFKTLFTNPARFYRVVNALNYGRQKGHAWNKLLGGHTAKYAQTLPWLNVLNNAAGAMAPTDEYQSWG